MTKLNYSIYIIYSLLFVSCIKQLDYSKPSIIPTSQLVYLYPYQNEVQNATAEIIIKTTNTIRKEKVTAMIPPLKYNKSWLFLLTQDDCVHSAYNNTWATIHGKPLSHKYYYDPEQLSWNDLPPDIYYLGKTLGSTDGAGNEVRFSFTTTLAPDVSWMNAKVDIKPGFTTNFYRFYKKNGLRWSNVREMMNYGCGIAFHNLNITNQTENMILRSFPEVQDSILKHLDGRGCKTLAEPDGNKDYVYAGLKYDPIQTMTAQAEAVKLIPFTVNTNLNKILMERWFNEKPSFFKDKITSELNLPKEERMAIHLEAHATDSQWNTFLVWLNDTYGKDGDDSMWAPSLEEYYEYNYYRIVGGTPTVEQLDEHTLKITVKLPSQQYFYYPAVTVNLKGLEMENIQFITSNDAVTGLSYSNYEDGVMLNVDCRRFLVEHATHYVEQHEKDKSNQSNQKDARYFVNMLKDSPQKVGLLNRISPN